MEGDKKAAVGVVLLVVIAAVVALTLSACDRNKPPSEVLQRTVKRIDTETNEIMSMTNAEWKKLGVKDGLYKNPKTEKFTMDIIHLDPETGEKMPYTKSPFAAEEREREAAQRAAGAL